MALVKKFSGSEEEMTEHGGCMCKNRGNLADFGGNPPQNWTPDDESELNEPYQGEGQDQLEKKSLVEDLTFGELVNVINSMYKDIQTLKNTIRRMENGG